MKNFPLLKNAQNQSLENNWEKTIIEPLQIVVNNLTIYSAYINPEYEEIET